MYAENTLKAEVDHLEKQYNHMVGKIEYNNKEIENVNGQIQEEERLVDIEKLNLQNQKENHLNLNNKIGELRNNSENYKKELCKLKEKVVEDPEETLKKRDESKSRLENSTQELSKNKTKLKQLSDYLGNCKLKTEVARDFANKLTEIIHIIRENNDYKNKLEDSKQLKKDTESEFIYHQNQAKLADSQILKIKEELNKLTNDFTQEKRHKDTELHDLTENVNKY